MFKRMLFAAGLLALAACWDPVSSISQPYDPGVVTLPAQQDSLVRRPHIKLDP